MIKALQLSHRVANVSDVQGHDAALTILNNISLEIGRGESVAIIGESGSGKSTLLAMLAGLDVPSEGEIFIDGHNITALDEEQRAAVRRRWVGFVFQNFQLLESLTALENVSLPLEVRDVAGAEARARDYLARVGLAQRTQHYPHQLSGGEQQRVALARAFACEAPIIFADEPTGNLDTRTGEHIADLLFTLNREHATTLILVTHAQALADRCQRQLLMNAGTLHERTRAVFA